MARPKKEWRRERQEKNIYIDLNHYSTLRGVIRAMEENGIWPEDYENVYINVDIDGYCDNYYGSCDKIAECYLSYSKMEDDNEWQERLAQLDEEDKKNEELRKKNELKKREKELRKQEKQKEKDLAELQRLKSLYPDV